MNKVEIKKFIRDHEMIITPKFKALMVTKNKIPYFLAAPPPIDALAESDLLINQKITKAIESVKKMKVGTFDEVDVPIPQVMGKCVHCGRDGSLKYTEFINSTGNKAMGYVCYAGCRQRQNLHDVIVYSPAQDFRPMGGNHGSF